MITHLKHYLKILNILDAVFYIKFGSNCNVTSLSYKLQYGDMIQKSICLRTVNH